MCQSKAEEGLTIGLVSQSKVVFKLESAFIVATDSEQGFTADALGLSEKGFVYTVMGESCFRIGGTNCSEGRVGTYKGCGIVAFFEGSFGFIE